MYLKIKEMKNAKLILDLTNGVYTIKIQAPSLLINRDVSYPIYEETIEEYEAIDYKIEEMVDRLNVVYGVLTGLDSEILVKTKGSSTWKATKI